MVNFWFCRIGQRHFVTGKIRPLVPFLFFCFIEPASLLTWYLGVKITHGPSTQQAMLVMECKLLYLELCFQNQNDTALRGFGKTLHLGLNLLWSTWWRFLGIIKYQWFSKITKSKTIIDDYWLFRYLRILEYWIRPISWAFYLRRVSTD